MSNDFFHGPEHEPFVLPGGPSAALLIHGFMGSPRDMRPLAQELVAAGVTTQGMLLPGFGADIDRLPRVKVAEWLDAARAAWTALRQDATRTTLIGFSMGGAVALLLAAEAGLAPDQLVLLAPHWKIADRRAVVLPIGKYFIRQLKPFGRIDFDNPAIRQMFAELAPGADLDDPAVRRRLRDHASIPTHALDELRRIGAAAMTAAPHVAAPTTIVQGQQDQTTLPAYSRTLAERMGAELREVPGDHILVDPAKPSWTQVQKIVIGLAAGPASHSP
jgi:carboxylesterase